MRLGELCAGYGGLGMAVEEVFSATTAWFSEYDQAPSKILAHHWPNVPNYGDMTKIDWASIEPVDIISGGTPCQDLSNAGKMRGMTEGTRSNLWGQMRQAIAIQKPTYVVWENVRGAFSAEASSEVEQCPGCVGDTSDGRVFLRAFGRVLGDLTDLGYDVQWRGIRASDVGAPHARFRVFVLAADRDYLGEHGPREWAKENRGGQSEDRRCSIPDARGQGLLEICGPGRVSLRQNAGAAVIGDSASLANAKRVHSERRGIHGDLVGAAGTREADRGERERHGDAPDDRRATDWGDYEPAIRRWEARLGRPAPRPTEPTGRAGGERLSPKFTEWMMGLQDGWVTNPDIGLTRNEQLKACGNGVVPQQAIAALRDMLAAFERNEIAA